MISNIGALGSAIKGLRRTQQNHGSIANARRHYLSIKNKRDADRAERKRKILALRNQ